MTSSSIHQTVVSRHGPPEVLRWVETSMPEPRAGEVRLKVLAAGVSAFDLMYRRWGWLPGSPKTPFTLGEDVVGVIDALGPGVASFELGQRVAGVTWARGVGGGYTESVCLPEHDVAVVPDAVPSDVAVCLVINYLTAYEHLHHFAEPMPGERMLVHGAAGGVGSALLELGKLAGLELYGTARRSGGPQRLASRSGAGDRRADAHLLLGTRWDSLGPEGADPVHLRNRAGGQSHPRSTS